MSANPEEVVKQRLEALSEFRFRLRSFLRFSEDAARDAGITVLQYQVLLHTQGFRGREWASVSEIAERLQAQPHGVVALVSRCEEAGLVRRQSSTVDRRLVEVHLLPKGRKVLAQRVFQSEGPADPNAAGAVKALGETADALLEDVVKWAAENAKM